MRCLYHFQLATYPLLLLLISCLNSTALAQEDLADVIERCEKSVVRIEVDGKDGESLGSGYVVDSKGTFVTNVHVLAGAIKAKAIFADGKSVDIKGTLHFDKSRDICVARLESGSFQAIKVNEKLPRKGETVTALGAPRGLSFTATNGIVSALREGKSIKPEYNGQWVQIDAALSPGNSGGPIINRSGVVIAMSTLASRGDSQNLNFGISCNDINDAIKKASSESTPLVPLAKGIGKVVYRDRASGGGGSGNGQIIQNTKVPTEALAKYIEDSRKDYAKLSKRFKDQVASLQKRFSQMKRGMPAFPSRQPSGASVLVAVDQKGRENFFFRNDGIKEREVGKTEQKLSKLREARKKIGKDPTKESLHVLLQHTGGFLDPREADSVGFMKSATSVRAFNKNEAMIEFDDQPYLMWLPSTSGLAGGNEINPMTVFVSGTQTMPGPRGSTSFTVLIAISDQELKEAIGNASDLPGTLAEEGMRKWTSGKFTVMAKLISVNSNEVTLKTQAGKEIVVPRTKLSTDDRNYLKAFD